MRAILIDPTIEGGLVTEGDWKIARDDVRSLYKILGVDNVERAGPLSYDDMVYVDGYGLLKPEPGPFFLIEGWDQPLAGRGLLLNETRSGYLAPPRTSLDQVKRMVSFPDLQLAGFEESTDLGMIFGMQAVFRPKGSG